MTDGAWRSRRRASLQFNCPGSQGSGDRRLANFLRNRRKTARRHDKMASNASFSAPSGVILHCSRLRARPHRSLLNRHRSPCRAHLYRPLRRVPDAARAGRSPYLLITVAPPILEYSHGRTQPSLRPGKRITNSRHGEIGPLVSTEVRELVDRRW